jgi:hypothetical protein
VAVRSGTWSEKIAEPYVVRRSAVSKRSLTPRRMPPAGSSTSAMNAFRPVSVNGVPNLGDDDGAGEENEHEDEEEQSQLEVLAGELGLHQKRIGSRAMATKRSAR